jgi:hypothetical protein
MTSGNYKEKQSGSILINESTVIEQVRLR